MRTRKTIDRLVAVVQAFADMGHSGTSAIFAISYLETSTFREPLGVNR